MTNRADFDTAFKRCPLIAILRGIRPDEVENVGEALADVGFTIIEVPLNSPDPFESIGRLSRSLAGRAVIGAGTVLSCEQVERLEAAGATIAIAPNANTEVIAGASERGLVAIPGFVTPTEAFAALEAGAAALKLFPAEAASPVGLKAMRAVLPATVPILPVGGITPVTMENWRAAGASGFGLGSALYQPGMTAADVRTRAELFIKSLPPS
ncbi:2-dehydro-3-deoxy-6-phosphogalactonate aldolase [Sphingopyxis sp. NJF-3]